VKVHRVTFLGIAVAVALMVALPAGATPPLSETVTESAAESVSCDGFDAILERTFSGLVTVYFDNEGNPLRVQVHAAMTGSLTNSVTGRSLPLRGHIFLVDDFTTGVVTFVGPVLLANDPGRGAVITDTGRISFSGDELVFAAGPHDAIDNPEILCTAVA
jgi:hypothetical protein